MHASIATIATTISVTIVIWLLKFDCKIEKKKIIIIIINSSLCEH